MPHYKLEQSYSGLRYISGVDEAGRGPWAGPVVAASVMFENRKAIPRGIDDSKKLDRAEREKLFARIMERGVVGVGIATVTEIDTLNIWGATSLAMRRAVLGMNEWPELALVDGKIIPKHLACEARAVVKGDAVSYSIAAASIIAKVTRDRLMRELAAQFPHYGFESHVGYGTPQHLNAIRTHGPCVHHRRNWPIDSLLQGDLFKKTDAA
jgi:ribonuclease HII